jgi:16S rRNA (adenine1518-N6/adenine1519-N6)-dimethyltransferase
MRALKRFGQHFLEAAWADKLIAAIDPQPEDHFLEIGPGPGALTLRLAPRVARLTAVEVDGSMIASLGPKLPPNVTLVHGDFLTVDPASLGERQLRVAGNLPYNVSSPILFKLIEMHRARGCGVAGPALLDATLMVQREVAARIEAKPGGRDYGVLAILVQLHADVRRALTLPPGAFRPAPRVHSAVVSLRFRAPRVPVHDDGAFTAMVRSMFTQRRKTLSNALKPYAESRGTSAAGALAAAGIDPKRRPETLQLEELARLAAVFSAR